MAYVSSLLNSVLQCSRDSPCTRPTVYKSLKQPWYQDARYFFDLQSLQYTHGLGSQCLSSDHFILHLLILQSATLLNKVLLTCNCWRFLQTAFSILVHHVLARPRYNLWRLEPFQKFSWHSALHCNRKGASQTGKKNLLSKAPHTLQVAGLSVWVPQSEIGIIHPCTTRLCVDDAFIPLTLQWIQKTQLWELPTIQLIMLHQLR